MAKVGRVKANITRFSGYVLSDDEAYWLGFLFTDGCLHGDKIIINLAGKDAEHLDKLATFFESPRRPRRWSRDRAIDGISGIRDYATFTLTSCVIATNLRRLGMHANKTWTILPWAGNAQRHFWRGCIDGDGSIHESRKLSRGVPHTEWRLHFCGNYAMVSGLAEYVASVIGIVPKLTKQNKEVNGNQLYSLRLGEPQAARIVDNLYDNAGIYLDRKYDAAKRLLERRKTRKGVIKHKCLTIGCERPYAAKGYCNSCWRANYRAMGRSKGQSNINRATTWTNVVTAA